MKSRALLLGVVLGWLCVGPAPAGARPKVNLREAAALARLRAAGEQALSVRDYAAAARAFTQLYRGTQPPEGLYLLGALAQAEGRVIDAQDLMRRYLNDPLLEPSESSTEQKEARRVLSLPRPPGGELNLFGERGTLVYLDGRLVGALPLSRPLLCGPVSHHLVLENGKHRQEEDVEVPAGRFIEMTYDRKSSALLSAELPGVLLVEDYPGLQTAEAAPLQQAIAEALQSERLSPFPLSQAYGAAMPARGVPPTGSGLAGGGGSRSLESSGPGPSGPQQGTLCAAECQCRIARGNELDYVLGVRVKREDAGKAWSLDLQVLDAEIGAEAAHAELLCAACDPGKAGAALRAAVAPLLASARRRPRGTLEVTSIPAGAEVRSADRVLGSTPLQQASFSGKVELGISLPGHLPQHLSTEVPVGGKAEVRVELMPEPATKPAVQRPGKAKVVQQLDPPRTVWRRSPRPRWRLALGGAAVGVAPLLLGFGGAALLTDGQCVVAPQAPVKVCRQVYNTGGLGTGLLFSGAAAVLGGVLLLAIPGPRHQVVLQGGLWPGGGGAALSLGF